MTKKKMEAIIERHKKNEKFDFLNCSLEEYKEHLRNSNLKHEREFAERVNEKSLYEIKQAYLKVGFESFGRTDIKVA